MNRSVRTVLLLLGLWLSSSRSHAGQTSNQPNVFIGMFGPTSYFYGGIGVARNSADTVQYMGCLVYGTTSSKSVFCSARDAAGSTAACSSSSPSFVEAVAAMTENSVLDIGFSQAEGLCHHVYVIDSSSSLPVSP